MDFNLMTNEEIRIKLLDLENSYETLKKDVQSKIDKMIELEGTYKEGKEILAKRGIS